MCFTAANDIKLVSTERETTEQQSVDGCFKSKDEQPLSCRGRKGSVKRSVICFVFCVRTGKKETRKASGLQLM